MRQMVRGRRECKGKRREGERWGKGWDGQRGDLRKCKKGGDIRKRG